MTEYLSDSIRRLLSNLRPSAASRLLEPIDKHLTLPRDDYIIDSRIHILENGLLEIAPGSNLYFRSGAGIVVNGTLIAEGKKDIPITFQPYKGEKWHNITFLFKPSGGSRMGFCKIKGGGGSADPFSAGNLYIDDVILSRTSRSHYKFIGGGVSLLESSPRIHDCLFGGNKAHEGGALFAWNCSPDLVSLTFRDNEAAFFMKGARYEEQDTIPDVGGNGGAICIKEAYPLISGCSFSNNLSREGGAIAIYSSSNPLNPIIADNLYITYNRAVDYGDYSEYRGRGGGIYLYDSNLNMVHTKISYNRADEGGGIYSSFKGTTSMTLSECEITRNAFWQKGGIYISNISKDTPEAAAGTQPPKIQPSLIQLCEIHGNHSKNAKKDDIDICTHNAPVKYSRLNSKSRIKPNLQEI